jgi:hypothetical protein
MSETVEEEKVLTTFSSQRISRDSSARIATGYGMDGWGLIPDRD